MKAYKLMSIQRQHPTNRRNCVAETLMHCHSSDKNASSEQFTSTFQQLNHYIDISRSIQLCFPLFHFCQFFSCASDHEHFRQFNSQFPKR